MEIPQSTPAENTPAEAAPVPAPAPVAAVGGGAEKALVRDVARLESRVERLEGDDETAAEAARAVASIEQDPSPRGAAPLAWWDFVGHVEEVLR